MTSADLLADAYGRVREAVHEAVEGLTADQLAHRPDEQANSVAWLIWHLTRVQDDHLAEVAGTDQVWTSAGWADRFGLALPADDTGFGHAPADVAAVRVDSGELLTGYHDAVAEESARFLQQLADEDLDQIIDPGWDPPVTLGVRLVSVLADDLQHVGQATYLRGLLLRS